MSLTDDQQDQQDQGFSRRNFIKTATAAAVGTTVATRFSLPGAYAAGSDEIRVGVIGCGGRGTGAIRNVLESAKGVKIVAMGDAFKDRIEESRTRAKQRYADLVAVPDDRMFVGLDAYKQVIAVPEVNYIILATPPGFRPLHLKAAIEAGKHVFTEKPIAVDPAGVREVLALVDVAKQKKLNIGTGTQRHHQAGYIETIKRIQDGAIGDIVSTRCYWNQGSLWNKERQAAWSDLEFQMRNWLYYTWLSGDHIVEQHIHNIDVINWVTNSHPVKAMGMGGRQVRTGPEFGHIFDHFAIDFEYDNGMHLMSMCRQIAGCANSVSEAVVGTKGMSQVDKYTITGANAWARPKNDKDVDPYVQEHTDLIAAIRKGEPFNELKATAESTLTAIMGRTSAYTGKAVTWDEILNSTEPTIVPSKLEWGTMPTPPVAMPGQQTSL
jgi:myo-inositol 2-dehydrogenase/D-chiro-inositol 1-dehydrogenase